MNEMLLRGCMLKNTGFVLGLVVYTGRETRIQRNAAKTPNKIGEGIPLLLPRWHIIMLIKLAPDNCCPLWFLCIYLFYVQLPGDPVCASSSCFWCLCVWQQELHTLSLGAVPCRLLRPLSQSADRLCHLPSAMYVPVLRCGQLHLAPTHGQ